MSEIRWMCPFCRSRNVTPFVSQGLVFHCVGCDVDVDTAQVLAQQPPGVKF
jgi:hypothetical protein